MEGNNKYFERASNSKYYERLEEVSERIWDICKLSPEHCNAVVDLIGNIAFAKISTIVNIVESKREKED